MLKKTGLVVLLLAAGVAIALYLRQAGQPATADAFQPRTQASDAVRIADLESALTAQVQRARALEARIATLEQRLGSERIGGEGERVAGAWRGSPEDPRGPPAGLVDADGRPDPAAMRERMRERQLQRFLDAGFTRQRAEWIERRVEELEVQAMQAQYEAQRDGRADQAQPDVQRALRSELGDAEYERYLTATGRPTEVRVMDVLASSPAERSGLQAGDQVLSYAGTRVFDMRELNALTREGSPGEMVTMEVRRDGQVVTVQVPRGVLGVSGAGARGPPGGAGGFRGGR